MSHDRITLQLPDMQDVQYGDIDYMESKHDFTYDLEKYEGLPEFVDQLHSVGMRYIVIKVPYAYNPVSTGYMYANIPENYRKYSIDYGNCPF